MGLFAFGNPPYGLEDVKVATNNLNGTYGQNFDVPSVQMLQAQFTTASADLEGDDRITATAARIIKGQVTFRMGGVNLEVLAVLLGQSIASSGGVGISAYRFIDIANVNLPQWGIIGRADAAEGGGDTHIWAPRCKVREGFQLKLEYSTFSIPEITVDAIGDEFFTDANGKSIVIRTINHNRVVVCTLPPSY
jgi:hypothetical protein